MQTGFDLSVVRTIAVQLPLLRLALGVLIAAVGMLTLRRLSMSSQCSTLNKVTAVAGGLAVMSLLALSFASLRSFLLDQDEANILSVAAAWTHGQPIYHEVYSTDLTYSLMYGPITFLTYGPLLKITGGNIFALRSFVVLMNLLIIVMLYLLARCFLTCIPALAVLAMPVSLFIQQTRALLGARLEPLGMVFLVGALLLATRSRKASWLQCLGAGALAGLAAGCKLTMLPAAAFACWILLRRHGWRCASYSVLGGFALVAIPFALSGVSAHNYRAWLQITAGEGLYLPATVFDVLFAMYLVLGCGAVQFFVLPADVAGLHAWRKWLPDAALVSAIVATAVVSGSKPGAGTWYFFPVDPVLLAYLANLAARHKQTSAGTSGVLRTKYLIASIAIVYATVALLYVPRGWSMLHILSGDSWRDVQSARDQIQNDLVLYRGHKLQVGYGDDPTDWSGWLRFLPVIQGHPYTVDGSIRLETYIIPFPKGVAAAMEHCRGDVWLIPKEELPFSSRFFPASVTHSFTRNFSKRDTGPRYDVWLCNTKL